MAQTTEFSLQTGLAGTTLHPPLQLQEKTSILTRKAVRGPQEDRPFCLVRLPHYDSLSGTSQTLFLLPSRKWWVDTETFLLSLFDFVLCGFMLSLNLLLFIAQV